MSASRNGGIFPVDKVFSFRGNADNLLINGRARIPSFEINRSRDSAYLDYAAPERTP